MSNLKDFIEDSLYKACDWEDVQFVTRFSTLCKRTKFVCKNSEELQNVHDLLCVIQCLGKNGDVGLIEFYVNYGLSDVINIFDEVLELPYLQHTENNAFIELLLDTVNSLSESSHRARTVMITRFCKCYFDMLIQRSGDFHHQMEILKSTNMLLENCPIVIKEELLEIQGIVERLASIAMMLKSAGDYEFQIGIVECLFRTISRKNRNFAEHLFKNKEICRRFKQIRDWEFETDCRLFLNELNTNLFRNKSVMSIPCIAAFLGDKKLCKPDDAGYDCFWVDFNTGSQRITLFCQQFSNTQQSFDGLWDTLSIWKKDVQKFQILVADDCQIANITLVKPVRDIFSSQQDVNGNVLQIQFSNSYSVEEALERTFQYETEVAKKYPKVSVAKNPVLLHKDNDSLEDSQVSCQAKISANVNDQESRLETLSQSSVSSKIKMSVPCVPMLYPRTVSVQQNTISSHHSENINLDDIDYTCSQNSVQEKMSSSSRISKISKPLSDIHTGVGKLDSHKSSTPKTNSKKLSKTKVKTPVVTVTSVVRPKSKNFKKGKVNNEEIIQNTDGKISTKSMNEKSKKNCSGGQKVVETESVPDSCPETLTKEPSTHVLNLLDENCPNSVKVNKTKVTDSNMKTFTSEYQEISEGNQYCDNEEHFNKLENAKNSREDTPKNVQPEVRIDNKEIAPLTPRNLRYQNKKTTKPDEVRRNKVENMTQEKKTKLNKPKNKKKMTQSKKQKSVDNLKESSINKFESISENLKKKEEQEIQVQSESQLSGNEVIAIQNSASKESISSYHNKVKGRGKMESETFISKSDGKECIKNSVSDSLTGNTNYRKKIVGSKHFEPDWENSVVRDFSDNFLKNDQNSALNRNRKNKTYTKRKGINDKKQYKIVSETKKIEVCNKDNSSPKLKSNDDKAKAFQDQHKMHKQSDLNKESDVEQDVSEPEVKSTQKPKSHSVGIADIQSLEDVIDNQGKTLQEGTGNPEIEVKGDCTKEADQACRKSSELSPEYPSTKDDGVHEVQPNDQCTSDTIPYLYTEKETNVCKKKCYERKFFSDNNRKSRKSFHHLSANNFGFGNPECIMSSGDSCGYAKEKVKGNKNTTKSVVLYMSYTASQSAEIPSERGDGIHDPYDFEMDYQQSSAKLDLTKKSQALKNINSNGGNSDNLKATKNTKQNKQKKKMDCQQSSVKLDLMKKSHTVKKSSSKGLESNYLETSKNSKQNKQNRKGKQNLKLNVDKYDKSTKTQQNLRNDTHTRDKNIQKKTNILTPNLNEFSMSLETKSASSICHENQVHVNDSLKFKKLSTLNSVQDETDLLSKKATEPDSILSNFSRLCQEIIADGDSLDDEVETSKTDLNEPKDDHVIKANMLSKGNTIINEISSKRKSCLNTSKTPTGRRRYNLLDVSIIKTPKSDLGGTPKTPKSDLRGTPKADLGDNNTDYPESECEVIDETVNKRHQRKRKQMNYKDVSDSDPDLSCRSSDVKKKFLQMSDDGEDLSKVNEPSEISWIVNRSYNKRKPNKIYKSKRKEFKSKWNKEFDNMESCEEDLSSHCSEVSNVDINNRFGIQSQDMIVVEGLVSGPSSTIRSSTYQNIVMNSDSELTQDDGNMSRFQPRELFKGTKTGKFIYQEYNKTESISDYSNGDTVTQSSFTPSIETEKDPGMTSLIRAFGVDIKQQMQTRRNSLEKLATTTLKSTQKQIASAWFEQHDYRCQVVEKFGNQLIEEVLALEKDAETLQELENKSLAFFKQQMEVLQKCRICQEQRLQKLEKLRQNFTNYIEKADKLSTKKENSVITILKNNLSALQKKVLAETQQEEMANVKKRLQSMFLY